MPQSFLLSFHTTALVTEPQQSGRMECPHLDKLCGRAGTVFPCLADGKRFRCGECGTEQSIWLCVTCGATNCGRYVAAHGLMHKVKHLCPGETTIISLCAGEDKGAQCVPQNEENTSQWEVPKQRSSMRPRTVH